MTRPKQNGRYGLCRDKMAGVRWLMAGVVVASTLAACSSSAAGDRRVDPNTLTTAIASGDPVKLFGDWHVIMPPGSRETARPITNGSGESTTLHDTVAVTSSGLLHVSWADIPATSAQVDAFAQEMFDLTLGNLPNNYRRLDRFDLDWVQHQATEATFSTPGGFYVIRMGAIDGHYVSVEATGGERAVVIELVESTANSLNKEPLASATTS